jgi:hypothetical protein
MKLPAAARRFAWALVVIALAGVYFLFGHLKYWPAGVRGPHGQFELSRPVATSGDEPHYLLIINSILFDHASIRTSRASRREATTPASHGRGSRSAGTASSSIPARAVTSPVR